MLFVFREKETSYAKEAVLGKCCMFFFPLPQNLQTDRKNMWKKNSIAGHRNAHCLSTRRWMVQPGTFMSVFVCSHIKDKERRENKKKQFSVFVSMVSSVVDKWAISLAALVTVEP